MKKQLLFNFTKVISQKMTFKMAAFAVLFLLTVQSSFAQSWDYLGKENEVSSLISGYSTIAVINESGVEVPYVGFAENAPLAYPINNQTAPGAGVLIVKKRLADGTWQKVGQTITNSGLHMRIYTNSLNELFVGYIDATNSSKLAVRKYNAGTNSWDALGGNSANLLVSTNSANSGYPTNTGNTIQRLSISFDANNMLYVAYCEPSNVVTIKRFNTTLATPAWETVGNGTTAPGVNIATGLSSSVAVVGTDVFISYLNMGPAISSTSLAGSIKLYKLDSATIGNAWTEITVPAGAGSTALFGRYLTMISNGNNLCFAYANTLNSTKAQVAFYNPTAASGTEWSGFWSLGSFDCRNISLIKDSAGNLYCSFIDAISSSYFSSQRVRFLKAGGNAWSELKNPLVIRGVDESSSWSAIGIANGSTVPLVVYIKRSSTTATLTPVVRKYIPSAVNVPLITGYSFATNTTVTPNVVTLTINGTNFTGATDISLNGASANGVPSPFTAVDDALITYVVPGATVAPVFSQLTVTTPNGTATLNATPPSALSYAAYPATYNGNPIVVSSVTPSDLLLYSVSPALPAGLSIARDSGTISGQSTSVTQATNYTVTVTNSFVGSATAIVNFATAGSAPSGLTYTPAVSASYTADTAITPLVATLTNATGAAYTVSPALPAGLMLNSTTGEISGTPTAAADFMNYEVKATTPLGFTTRVIAFLVTPNLSTSDFVNDNQVTLYPNPSANGIFTVDYPSYFSGAKLTIINTLGQAIFQTTVGDGSDTIETSGLRSGLYFVKLESANNSVVKKLVVK